MIGRTLSHFKIIGKIGEGGMGVVYRAEDLDLGRQVALKLLHTEFVTDDERRKRFMREARTAASISHPNIATIHEVGECDGVIFIAMEFVEGRTLKRVIQEDRPEIDECLRFAIEICEGLASAHQATIVHRDLKPENILIDSEQRVRILDFGLAKLYEDPTKGGGDSSGLQTISASVTRDGRILGTVQYMSPEQARGVELDARSDVFSLGIVLYELITGQVPFQGETITDTLTSILRDDQPPIAKFNPRVPVELERILTRCLEKNAAGRYQNAAEVLGDLRKLKRLSDSQPVPLVSDTGPRPLRLRRLPWKRISGLAATAVLLVALGAAGAAVLRSTGWLPGSPPPQQAMAVLPFENLQERDDPERLGQILQELIITDLSGFDSLKVLSSQRLFDVQKQLERDTGATIGRDTATRVARRAGADTMLTGSLSRLGPTWIVTCQLIDLRDGSVLQSDRIDGTDLYALVDDLTTVVRQNLDVDPTRDMAVTQRTSSSLAAYQAYLAGVDALNALDFSHAIQQFEEAVRVDPSFGKAYYKLAISRWWGGSVEDTPSEGQTGTASDALNELLGGDAKLSRKDRMLAEAFLQLVESHPDQALPLFGELVELYPDEKEAHYGLGEARFHSATRYQARMAALEPFETAIELDPSFSLSFFHVVDLYAQAERYEEGIDRVRGFIEQDPENVSWYQDLARLALAKKDDPMFESVVDEGMRRIDARSDQRRFLVGLARAVPYRDLDRRQILLEQARDVETDVMQQDLLIGLGEVATGRREFEKAEKFYRRAHQLNPRSTSALNALFRFYDRTLRYDDAQALAKRLVESDPEFPPYYGHWVASAIKRGDGEEIKTATQAVAWLAEQRPDDPAVMRSVGPLMVDAYFRVDDYVHAEELLLGGLDSYDPATVGNLYNSLGKTALSLARPADAEDWFHRAFENSIMKDTALAGLYQTHLVRGDLDKAREYAERLDDSSGGKGRSRAMLIELHIRAGEDEKADALTEATLETLTEKTPRRSFLRDVAEAYLAAGRFTDAERMARQARKLEGDDPPEAGITRLLAWSLMNQGRAEEAGQLLTDGIEAAPAAIGLQVLQAFNSLVAGETETAIRQAEVILDRGPAVASAHVAMAYALGQQGDFVRAAPHAERALAMTPDRTSRTLMAWVLIAGEIDVDRGLEMAVKAVDTPDSYLEAAKELTCMALAEHCLGVVYLKQGRYKQAVEILTEATRLRPGQPAIHEQLEQASRLSVRSGS